MLALLAVPTTPWRRFLFAAAVTALWYSGLGLIVGRFPSLWIHLGSRASGFVVQGVVFMAWASLAAPFVRILLGWRARPSVQLPPRADRDAASFRWFGVTAALLLASACLGAALVSVAAEPGSLSGRIAHLSLYAFMVLLGASGGLIAVPRILAVVRKGLHPTFRPWAAGEAALFAGAACGPLLAGALWNQTGVVALSRAEAAVVRAGYPTTPPPAGPKLADRDNAAFYYRRNAYGRYIAE